MNVFHKISKATIDNSPAILTGLGVVGVLTTAYLAGDASIKAHTLLYNEDSDPMLTLKERVSENRRDLAMLYLPAAAVATTTCLCIIGANRIGGRRAAALAAAYTISEKTFTEYRDKAVETLGKKKEEEMRGEIAKDRLTKNPPSAEVCIISGPDALFYDMHTDRYFKSDMETIKKGMNDTNYRILLEGYQNLNDFYERIGLPTIPSGDEVGWNTDKTLDLHFAATIAPNNQPAITFEFHVVPIRGYRDLHR